MASINNDRDEVIDKKDSENDSVEVDLQFVQNNERKIIYEKAKSYIKSAVLIDTGSICSVFRSSDMLVNVCGSGKMLRAHTNGGHQDYT